MGGNKGTRCAIANPKHAPVTRQTRKKNLAITNHDADTHLIPAYPEIGQQPWETQQNLPHAMNTTKALSNKLVACDRQTILDIELIDCGYVSTCFSAYYELMKASIIRFIESTDSLLVKKNTAQKDQNGATQSLVLRVTNSDTGRLFCTITLYNTTSKILINGKSAAKFVNEHIPELHKKIANELASINTSTEAINSILWESIKAALQPICDTTHSRPRRSSASGKLAALPPCAQTQSLLDEEMDQPMEDVCPLCNRTTEGNTIYCDICGMWLHKKCEQISDMDYNTLEHSNLPYTCSICRPLDPSTQLPVSPQDYNAPSASTLVVMPTVSSGLASQADSMDTNKPGPGPPVTTRHDPHQDNNIQENVATIQHLSDSTIPAIRPVTMTTMGNMVPPRAAQHLSRHPTPVTNQHLTRNSTPAASQHLARQPTPAANQHLARQPTPAANQHLARQLTPPVNNIGLVS